MWSSCFILLAGASLILLPAGCETIEWAPKDLGLLFNEVMGPLHTAYYEKVLSFLPPPSSRPCGGQATAAWSRLWDFGFPTARTLLKYPTLQGFPTNSSSPDANSLLKHGCCCHSKEFAQRNLSKSTYLGVRSVIRAEGRSQGRTLCA